MAVPTGNVRAPALFALATAVTYWALLLAVVLAVFGPSDVVHKAAAFSMVVGGLPVAAWISVSLRRSVGHSMHELAFRDELTGLPNRRALLAQAEATLHDSPAGGIAIVLFDVDGLKAVNDGCGHQAGDELIRLAAQHLERPVGRHKSVFRIGGDEFAALIDREHGGSVTNVLRAVKPFRARFSACGHEHVIAMSSGYASSMTGDSFDRLFRQADRLLMESKRRLYAAGDAPDRRATPTAEALVASAGGGRGGFRVLRPRVLRAEDRDEENPAGKRLAP